MSDEKSGLNLQILNYFNYYFCLKHTLYILTCK